MANNTNLKKIEKLRKKLEEVNERIKCDVQKKNEILKEIESLEAEGMVNACKSSNITFAEAVESFDIFKELKENGVTFDDIKNFLASNHSGDNTLSPLETKSEEVNSDD